MNGAMREKLQTVYGEQTAAAEKRYDSLEKNFRRLFGQCSPSFFTAPGRTEIIGNHTDHNGGKIIAASITMDTIGAAAKNNTSVVNIISEGYSGKITVDLKNLQAVPKCRGTVSLLGGIMEAVEKIGFKAGGFDAYVSTEVIRSAGVSSSASFEMLICAMLNHFFNDGKMDYADYARIGQYAENRYWDKASGLMDQLACAVGGTILLDLSDGVKYEKLQFSFADLGYDLVILNTGKGHADLSEEYSSIPNEMRMVADRLGGKNLCETSEEKLLASLGTIRKELGNDRAILRALHYFEECARVEKMASALQEKRIEEVSRIIDESGRSSWEWLQNCIVTGHVEEQSIPLMLALTKLFINRIGGGVCRVHGGGFAGVIMCLIPKAHTEEFRNFMTPYAGRENIHIMGIRQTGAICLLK